MRTCSTAWGSNSAPPTTIRPMYRGCSIRRARPGAVRRPGLLQRRGADPRLHERGGAAADRARRGEVHFYSRSREEIWRKGEASGNVLRLRQLRYDCDGDAICRSGRADRPRLPHGGAQLLLPRARRLRIDREGRRRRCAASPPPRPRGAGGPGAHPAQPRRRAPRGQLHREAARRPDADRRKGRGGGRGGRPRRA